MLGKFTAMQDSLSQRCLKSFRKSPQPRKVAEMFEKLTAIQDRLSQRCVTTIQDSLSQRCLESWQPCRIACPRDTVWCRIVCPRAHSLPILHGCKVFKRLWDSLSCMAVSFSCISGQPILHGCELFKHFWHRLPCMAVSSSSISGASYPACLWAFQASLGQAILHGCELFKQLWDSLSCMAVRYPAWLWAFQASLRLDGCEAFLVQPILRAFQASLGLSISCMAGTTKGLIKIAYMPWNVDFQRDT